MRGLGVPDPPRVVKIDWININGENLSFVKYWGRLRSIVPLQGKNTLGPPQLIEFVLRPRGQIRVS